MLSLWDTNSATLDYIEQRALNFSPKIGLLGTLKAQYFAKIQGSRLERRIDFAPICVKIGALVSLL